MRAKRYPDCTRFGEVAIDDVVQRIMTAPVGAQEVTIRTETFRIGCLLADRDISERRGRETIAWLVKNIPDRGPEPWDRRRLREKIERAVAQGEKHARECRMGADFSDYQEAAKGFGEPTIAGRHLAGEWWRNIRWDVTSVYIVDGVFEKGTTSVAYGDSGSGKTFFAAYLAFCIALGRPFFGREVTRGLVVYIAAEAGASMRRRIAAFRRELGLEAEGDVPFFLIASPVDLLDSTADLVALIAEIKRAMAEQPDYPLLLIVIDTLSRVLAGGDENSAKDMGHLVRNIERLRAETQAHLLIVHHTGKDANRGARGHNLLRAAIDTELEVSKSANLGVSTAQVTKQRDAETGAVFAFRLKPVELGHDQRGKVITSCILQPLEEGHVDASKPKAKKAHPLPPDYQRALDFLHDAVADVGQPLNRLGLPNLKAVTLNQWREHLRRRGLYDGDDDARSWFRRVKARLIGDRLITIDGDWIWPVPRLTVVVTPFPGRDERDGV
jgi:hypothetical protein